MHISINGDNKYFEKQPSVEKIIAKFVEMKSAIVVEVNGTICNDKKLLLNDGDKVEIVTFVGGG